LQSSFVFTSYLPEIVTLAALFGAGWWDLKTAKVKNWFVLTVAGFAVTAAFSSGGGSALGQGGLAFLAALGLSLPLVLTRVLGAGDMKILMACALCWDPTAVMDVLIWSIVWGGALGLLRAILDGKGVILLKNVVGLFYPPWKAQEQAFSRIPFTVAFLMAWLSLSLPRLYNG
jgi:Flp pilus assembly protein protease CpaA